MAARFGHMLALLLDELDDTLEGILQVEHTALQMGYVGFWGCVRLFLDHLEQVWVLLLAIPPWSFWHLGFGNQHRCLTLDRLDGVVGQARCTGRPRTPVSSQRSILSVT